LQSFALKGKESASKFKEKGDEVPVIKNLLLLMVRLIHADPMLMLNVSMCDTHVHIKMEVFVEFVGIEEEYQTVL
jgi:hypothetical protein